MQFAPENWFMSDRNSVYFGAKSAYFIDALEDTEVVMLDNEYYLRAISLSKEFASYNDFLLHNHILQMHKRIAMLIGASAEDRYLEFLKLYPELSQRIP
jgi:CRP/FNR family transcriptional regulator, anaerobic regulatory protein